MTALLRREWDRLCTRVAIDDGGLFDALWARYAAEPQRRYHDGRHLVAVVERVLAIADAVDAPDDVRDAALLGAWFHDAVYEPRAAAGANERASADLARHALSERGAPAWLVERVGALVEATAGHGEPDRLDAALVFDADLAVLASDDAEYDAYAAAIREEYAFVPDEVFRRGRSAVLASLLRGPLFSTPPMQAVEHVARANLTRELARLAAPEP